MIKVEQTAKTVDEAIEIVPVLNATGVLAATYCPTDGNVNH